MTDADIDNFGMGGLAIRQNARAFIDMKKDRTVVEAEVAKQVGGLMDEIKELKAQLAAKPQASEKSEQPAARKERRKRRTKAEMEAAKVASDEAA